MRLEDLYFCCWRFSYYDKTINLSKADGFGLLARRSIAEAPTDINVTTNSSFILAADRTYRRDPLNGFRKYPGGWNITEVHYFAVSHLFPKWCISIVCLHLLALYDISCADFFVGSPSDIQPFHCSPLLWRGL